MTDEEKIKNRKLTLIILAGLVVIVLAIWLTPAIIKMFKKEPEIDYGPGVEIVDLKKQISDIPDDYVKNLEADLYIAIKKNSSSVDSEGTKAQIRAGSIKSTDDADEKSYYRSFIVDIESLKQSYRVQLNWALGEDGSTIPYGYPIVVSCLFTTDEAIYGDFGCMDDFMEMNL